MEFGQIRILFTNNFESKKIRKIDPCMWHLEKSYKYSYRDNIFPN